MARVREPCVSSAYMRNSAIRAATTQMLGKLFYVRAWAFRCMQRELAGHRNMRAGMSAIREPGGVGAERSQDESRRAARDAEGVHGDANLERQTKNWFRGEGYQREGLPVQEVQHDLRGYHAEHRRPAWLRRCSGDDETMKRRS